MAISDKPNHVDVFSLWMRFLPISFSRVKMNGSQNNPLPLQIQSGFFPVNQQIMQEDDRVGKTTLHCHSLQSFFPKTLNHSVPVIFGNDDDGNLKPIGTIQL